MRILEPADARKMIERQIRHWDGITAVLQKAHHGPIGERPLAEVTRRPALTVSGMVGSGEERLAAALCQELEYELFGRELLDAVATDLQCQRLLLDNLDERVQLNLKTMFESLIRGREIENRDYLGSLVRVIGSLADMGGAVILGRGGSFILGGRAALRVFVDAPRDVRVRRIMDERRIPESEARRFVETREQEQKKFIRYYFSRELTDPSGYDLCISTERIEPEKGVALVKVALAAHGVEIRKLPRPPETVEALEGGSRKSEVRI